MGSSTSIIPAIRNFNRFYTKVLGLLDKQLLDSDFSLPEARVLYEIGNTEYCTAKLLTERLNMDAGYLSRMLKRFEKLGLIHRVPSEKDGRSFFLYLSSPGEETLSNLNTLSEEQIQNLVAGIPPLGQISIAKSMASIERELSNHATKDYVSIRTELKPGDIGMLIHMHGWIYAKECGYDHTFEGYVCKTFYDLLQTYSPDKDRFWLAEVNGEIVGSIAIIGHTQEKAQLRWFMLHPDARGMGLGSKLLQEAISYCRGQGFQFISLETTEDQKTAIRMYMKAGFKKLSEQETESWGKRHLEQTYLLNLRTIP
ncbi:bifunctional helix-turn-helix transcriptional regulator/GNAT family N-acetyltransferase [Paenibacillus tepidiphilus]|uniref:bifunctional helix-turn-helix transcriptional regulator/GNAT family N-acetyltransferase n=1 Tax=Paenibacillus tepidiphilus TaxID=2608683 RepID=UPI00123A05AB|nr:helix-turn-helix domain-containing GNAT family N-acetyltransferase [Paenibacillus tepidiphilus]